MDRFTKENPSADGSAEKDARWAAIISRDPSADGTFYYSVTTTGVYCHPSCAARAANPKNVRFHPSSADAEAAGFRPCLRCKPDQPSITARYTAKVTEACRLLETADEAPALATLAQSAELSPYHFHRVFKRIVGLTPRQYAAAHRATRIRTALETGNSVTEAIYESGYNSNSRFYEKSNAILGMKPLDYRAGGSNAEIHFAVGECSLGSILVARSEKGVCAIFIGEDPGILLQDLQNRFPKAKLIGADAAFEQMAASVIGFVEAPSLGLDLPLDVRGTAFQRRVWQALQEIPMGKTLSYTDIAKKIGIPKAVRAVAGACAANPLAVVIPCHRVIKNDGSLSGYRWGIERKRLLLDKETAKEKHELQGAG